MYNSDVRHKSYHGKMVLFKAGWKILSVITCLFSKWSTPNGTAIYIILKNLQIRYEMNGLKRRQKSLYFFIFKTTVMKTTGVGQMCTTNASTTSKRKGGGSSQTWPWKRRPAFQVQGLGLDKRPIKGNCKVQRLVLAAAF